MRAHKTTIAALALVAGLSLTACQGAGDSAAGSDDPVSSTASPEASASSTASSSSSASDRGGDATATSTATATAPGDTASGGGRVDTGPCKTANLAFSTSHGMGEGDLMVVMKNTGDACSLKGFPGVDLKADDGPGGISARRSDRPAPTVALGNGDETRFTLHTPRNDTGGSGLDIVSIVVTPPNETHSKTLPVSLNLPVSDSTESKVTVDPVGSGKQ